MPLKKIEFLKPILIKVDSGVAFDLYPLSHERNQQQEFSKTQKDKSASVCGTFTDSDEIIK